MASQVDILLSQLTPHKQLIPLREELIRLSLLLHQLVLDRVSSPHRTPLSSLLELPLQAHLNTPTQHHKVCVAYTQCSNQNHSILAQLCTQSRLFNK